MIQTLETLVSGFTFLTMIDTSLTHRLLNALDSTTDCEVIPDEVWPISQKGPIDYVNYIHEVKSHQKKWQGQLEHERAPEARREIAVADEREIRKKDDLLKTVETKIDNLGDVGKLKVAEKCLEIEREKSSETATLVVIPKKQKDGERQQINLTKELETLVQVLGIRQEEARHGNEALILESKALFKRITMKLQRQEILRT